MLELGMKGKKNESPHIVCDNQSTTTSSRKDKIMKKQWNEGLKFTVEQKIKYYPNRFSNEEVFVENSSYPRHRLKARIIQEGLLPYECAIDHCGVKDTWHGKRVVLVLDHINGINNDNRLENLRLVCSNCDSQLPTYKSRNIINKRRAS
jgi:hypothetical protein